jgi:hypothetical protein
MELRLEHKQPALDGLLTFDGQVVEAFGFNDVRSVRMPVRLLEKVTVSFKSGLIAQPTSRSRAGTVAWASSSRSRSRTNGVPRSRRSPTP